MSLGSSDGANGNEMHILYWKYISIWAKVSQVSDVAHGPLVLSFCHATVTYCVFPVRLSKTLPMLITFFLMAINGTVIFHLEYLNTMLPRAYTFFG
jgi:hypothetical protein